MLFYEHELKQVSFGFKIWFDLNVQLPVQFLRTQNVNFSQNIVIILILLVLKYKVTVQPTKTTFTQPTLSILPSSARESNNNIKVSFKIPFPEIPSLK